MDHSNWKIYRVPFRLHTFRFKTRTRTGRTLGTTKLGHLPSIPSRCSLGCRQCTTLQFMAITTAECRMREIETSFIWLAHQVWLIAKWGHLTAFSFYWGWPLLENKYFGGWNAPFAKTHKKIHLTQLELYHIISPITCYSVWRYYTNTLGFFLTFCCWTG
jgi:hypothetical protein